MIICITNIEIYTTHQVGFDDYGLRTIKAEGRKRFTLPNLIIQYGKGGLFMHEGNDMIDINLHGYFFKL